MERGAHDRSVPNDTGLKVIELKVCSFVVFFCCEIFSDQFMAEKSFTAPRKI